MAKFGRQSLENLRGVHPAIVAVLIEAVQYMDFSVLEGVRSVERQVVLYENGDSSTMNSLHIKQPDGYAHAVDVAPYPIDWDDKRRFAYLAGLIMGIAEMRGTPLTWGGHWTTLVDMPHFQLRHG